MSETAKSARPSVRLTFYGAAKTVTGSRYLVECDDSKYLFDCGLFQGKKKVRKRNWEEPGFDISKLSGIILTHAHIDHTGYLPLLVKRGYKGPIYCTAATAELLHLLLPDTAHLQEEEARYANKHGTSSHKPAKPLYSQSDAKATLKLLRTIPRDEATELEPNVHVTPKCAGHILGSTSLTLDIQGRRIIFSGDIGRYDTPLLPDPQPVDFGDLLLCESTYGNRLHAAADARAELAQVIKIGVDRGGPIIIPAFAIGRTQNLLYYIAELERDGLIPSLPVYVDSPMAVDATKIYRKFKHDYDSDAQEIMRNGDHPLLTEQTFFCRSVDESKRLNSRSGPMIIISASGMVNGGRILHHMMRWLPNEQATVLFVGYQAEGTRGRIIQSGAKEIKIFGKYIPVRANVDTISGLSAHGDQSELVRWLRSGNGTPGFAKIVHGEPEAATVFSYTLNKEFDSNASPAELGETVEL